MSSDEALHERLLAGDLAAFDALYDRHERHLFAFIRTHLDPAEAEDVLQEAFLAVVRERADVRTARCFKAWLFQVARNLCLNRLRSRRRAAQAMAAFAHEPPPDAPAGAPDRLMADRETAAALRRAVDRLPAALAELYALRASGLSYEELADVLVVPVGTVKSRMHEMVSRLREEMQR